MSRRLTSQALSREEEDTVIKDALLDGIDVEGCEVAYPKRVSVARLSGIQGQEQICLPVLINMKFVDESPFQMINPTSWVREHISSV